MYDVFDLGTLPGHLKRKFALVGIAGLLLVNGCNVGNSVPAQQSFSDPTGAVSVSISPKTGSVQVGMSFQFTATVQGDSANKGVVWSIPAASGCDCGTIDSTGKYLAPKTAHDDPGLIIMATSVSDPTRSNTAVVFVTPAPTAVSVSPAVVSVLNNGVQQFKAVGVPFDAVPVVTWSVSGGGCTAEACGTVDAAGKYIAPATIPSPPQVKVTATSMADALISGFSTVTIGNTIDNAKLSGQYAFLIAGYDGGGNAELAGSFTADGNGNISNGVGDYVFSSEIDQFTGLTFTGNYSVNADNRATMTIAPTTSRGASLPAQTFSLALSSFNGGVASRGQLIELDNEEIIATGVLAKQDPSAFSTAAVTGGYAFGFTGTAISGYPMTAAGRFTASNGSLTSGEVDVFGLGLAENGSGTVTAAPSAPFTGVYEIASNGHGTATLTFAGEDPGFSQFSFYVVSAKELLFIETDISCPAGQICTTKAGISGTVLQQSGGPYSASSFRGASIFNLTSADVGEASGGSVSIGQAIFDGNDNVVETREENSDGKISSGLTTSGTYTLDPNGLGRGVITLPGDLQPKPFYMVSAGKAFIVDLASSEAGMFEPQTTGPFSNASISGNYELGTFPWDFNWAFNPVTGILTADGAGNLLETTDSKGGSGTSFTGSYSVAPNGRATMTTDSGNGSPSSWVFYLVSPSKGVGIEVTPGATNSAIRIIEK